MTSMRAVHQAGVAERFFATLAIRFQSLIGMNIAVRRHVNDEFLVITGFVDVVTVLVVGILFMLGETIVREKCFTLLASPV